MQTLLRAGEEAEVEAEEVVAGNRKPTEASSVCSPLFRSLSILSIASRLTRSSFPLESALPSSLCDIFSYKSFVLVPWS